MLLISAVSRNRTGAWAGVRHISGRRRRASSGRSRYRPGTGRNQLGAQLREPGGVREIACADHGHTLELRPSGAVFSSVQSRLVARE